jgi:hypothetical protein
MRITQKIKYRCTCHRIHKNLGVKCKIHKHITLTRKVSSIRRRPSSMRSSRRQRSYRSSSPRSSSRRYQRIKHTTIDLNKFVQAIEKIKECKEDDLDNCWEMKNYINVNICSIESDIKEILFYFNYLPHKTQHIVYNKIINETTDDMII